MKEVKTPKKPLAYYYGIVLIVLIVFNLVVTPILMEHQVKETDYGTFMSMIEKKNIGEVEVKDNQIIFTDKDQKNIYKTGLMNNPNLTDRLYECGAVFAKDIDKQMSPIISFLLTGVLPLILFIALGNYMAKKLMEHAGGKNSMAFGMGKSNAKIYVQSSEGIRFSALRAVRSGRTVVNESDLEESIEVVIAGYQKKNAVLSDQEKKVVAYHEIGHALVAALQSHSAPVQKITIIPRTSGALGYTMQVEQGDKYLMTKKELENKIATFTGGRAAEEIVFGEITTGASNDIEQATKIARAMITRYGMTDEFDMVAMENVTNQYLGGDTSLSCSADTQKEIDEKVVQLVKAEHEKARKILAENREKLDELAMYLYEKETITGDEFMDILDRK